MTPFLFMPGYLKGGNSYACKGKKNNSSGR